jgi:site-specific DNA-methyltransferase (adenine-specific)
MGLNCELLTLLEGDCRDKLKQIPSQSVDLVFTSPPYAERRKKNYASIPADEYVSWFLPIGYELKRILKPSGSFFLNLKSHCHDGERDLYVYELVIALKKLVRFCFVDEYVWYKSASPRKKGHRLKDSWEPIWHFSLGKNYINHEAIHVRSKSVFLNKRGYTSFNSTTGNIGGYHAIADQGDGYTDPDNLLYYPTSLLVKDSKYNHPAKFPLELADFIVRGFCPPQGTVCDPFIGSGMTALAALRLGCCCYGVELSSEYCKMSQDRINSWVEPEKIHLPAGMNDLYPDD